MGLTAIWGLLLAAPMVGQVPAPSYEANVSTHAPAALYTDPPPNIPTSYLVTVSHVPKGIIDEQSLGNTPYRLALYTTRACLLSSVEVSLHPGEVEQIIESRIPIVGKEAALLAIHGARKKSSAGVAWVIAREILRYGPMIVLGADAASKDIDLGLAGRSITGAVGLIAPVASDISKRSEERVRDLPEFGPWLEDAGPIVLNRNNRCSPRYYTYGQFIGKERSFAISR